MKTYKSRIWAILVSGILLAAGQSSATTVVRKSVAQMAVESTLVVEGVVAGKRSVWDETGQYIITEVYIDVTGSLKGKSPRRITVRTLGGVVGDVGMSVAGSPHFEVGDEALLMLERHPARDWRIVGFHQGKFNITTDKDTGVKTVSGVALPAAMPLVDFKKRLTSIIEGSGK